MLYCNCHYRYRDQLCELLGFLPNTGDGSRKVRIRLRNDREVICSENDLEEIPLTESILQSCYKMKTIVRDGEWDVLWHLGGKNNVTIGEKQSRYFLIPPVDAFETVVDILPNGIVHNTFPLKTDPTLLIFLSELDRVCPNILYQRIRID